MTVAGPVTGPVIAGLTFGWVPTFLWIIIGTIFIGGMHDMGSLVASIRNKACGIAETMRRYVSMRVWILFNVFIFFTLVMIIVAFTDITTAAFVNTTDLENGEKVGGGAIATSSILYLIILFKEKFRINTLPVLLSKHQFLFLRTQVFVLQHLCLLLLGHQ